MPGGWPLLLGMDSWTRTNTQRRSPHRSESTVFPSVVIHPGTLSFFKFINLAELWMRYCRIVDEIEI
jgi:hypothetical protein